MPSTPPERVARAFAAALNAGDLEGALALWTDDAVLVPGEGVPVQGRDRIKGVLAALIQNETIFGIDIAHSYVAGATAAAVGMLTVSGRGPDGEQYETASRFAVVYARGEDGSWRIAIDAPLGFPAA